MLPQLEMLLGRGSETGGFGQVHPEPVAAALVAAGHLRGRVAELLLDVAFVNLG